MNGYQPHPYAILLLISALVSSVLGAVALARRESSGMRALGGIACLLAFWALSYSLAWSSTDPQVQRFWFYTMYLAVLSVPLVFLSLVLQVTRQAGWLTPWRFILLSLEPAFMLLIIWTNDYHNLFITSFNSYTVDGLQYFFYQRGPLYWVNVAYSYSILLACMLVLVYAYLHTSPVFRRQIAALVTGASIPWLANMVSLARILPISGLDLTPIAFGATVAIFYYALYDDVRMDLLPLARSLLLHATSDGLLVLDSDLRIVDINLSAEQAMGLPAREIIGQHALDLFPEWQDMIALIRNNRQEIRTETQSPAEPNRYYDVKATPIRSQSEITGYLVLFRDITDRWHSEQDLRLANQELKIRLQEIENLQRELRLQATRDPLTSLYNRRHLEESLEKELARAERRSLPVSIIMMDADNFKHINDRFGHKAGDLALQALARIITRHIRTSDIACRYGGEEFVIVMPNTEPEIARQRAENIRQDFYQVEFDGPESAGESSLSIGIAAYPRAGLRGDALLDAADQAMYAAKKSGGNRIKLFKELKDDDSKTLKLDRSPGEGKDP